MVNKKDVKKKDTKVEPVDKEPDKGDPKTTWLPDPSVLNPK